MVNVFVEVSKYLLILLMAVYTYQNFSYFRFREERKRKSVCRRQTAILLVLHFLACLNLYLETQQEQIVLFYLAQVVFFATYGAIYRLFYPTASRLLANNICMFLCVGFVVLTRLSMDHAIKQFLIASVSSAVTLVVPAAIRRLDGLDRLKWVYGGIGFLLLLAVWIGGSSSFGAMLSLTIGGIAFQPSEFVKLTIVFFVAAMFSQRMDLSGEGAKTPRTVSEGTFSVGIKTVAVSAVVTAAHILVLVLSTDLGSGLIFFVAYLMMLFVATSGWLYLLAGVLGGCGASLLAYRLFSHVQTRVAAWMDPWADIDNRGYQITQSLFAIGTGGWFGMGLYQGMPYKIPVVEKDFVFAAISEEMGGIFALCVLLLYLGCFLQIMMIAGEVKGRFCKLLAFGLGMEYLVQVVLAVGGAIKFIPSTGVTLPFISYGGSSLLSMFLVFGVIQGLHMRMQDEEVDYE